MDADTLRLILIVVGTALVLALYLWERSRAEAYDDDGLPLTNGEKQEPSFGYIEAGTDPAESELAATVTELKGQREAAAVASLQAASRRAAAIPQAAVHLVADASAEPEPDDPGGANTLILQLGIRARAEDMRGADILDVAARCGLRPGELGAFHHKVMVKDSGAATISGTKWGDEEMEGEGEGEEDEGEETRTLFSMVSMVKPGEFPFDAMEDFRTRGLLLFAVLHRGPDNLQILDDMIAAARRLADEFDAEVLDERRKPLTPIMVDVLRARVLEFNRMPAFVRR
jgi:cell division protein ZipA